MLVNTSSSNYSLLHPHHSTNNSQLLFFRYCYVSRENSLLLLTFNTTTVFLLLPLYVLVLYHGFQQWWRRRSTSSAVTMSHGDIFTCHMAIFEIIGVSGQLLILCAFYLEQSTLLLVGFFVISFTWFGNLLFHVLTCVERYLAVVHPITYLSLRNERGVRLRNISIGCVWLLSFVWMNLLTAYLLVILDFCIIILSLIVVSFCSLSVLCVLIRPGPGQKGGDRQRVDQSKRRALFIILAILGVLVVRFALSFIWAVINASGGMKSCVMLTCDVWFNLPSSVLLPLLFLHRAGKLTCCAKTIKEEHKLDI